MNKRDLIIIAVLVNAGLLAILFMMALHNDDEHLNEPIEITQILESPATEISADAEQIPALANKEEDNEALKSLASTPSIEEETIQDLDQDDEVLIKPEIKQETVATAAPEKETSPVTEAKKTLDITVKKGDSLDKIARANGSTIQAIKNANSLKTDKLSIGQVLKVPVTKEKTTVAKAKPKASSEKAVAETDSTQYYTVKSGDSPWKIAKQNNMSVDELLKLNQMDETRARNLKIGEKIRIQ